MTDRNDAEPEPDKSLLLDELDEKFAAFQAFRKSDDAAANEILGNLGAQDDVDRLIVLELSSPSPLGHPAQFPRAHRMAVRALEVLDRNGGKSVRVRGAGPLSPIASFLAQQVAQFIIRSHQSSVVTKMLELYARREANAEDNDPAKLMLTRARIQMQRLAPGFKRNALGVPLFVVGGALASTALSLLQRAAASAFKELWSQILATVLIGLFLAGVAWVILRGAAVARRRIQLTLDGPIGALWQTIGRCGKPPKDPSKALALVAVVLAALPWVLIPVGIALTTLIDTLSG